MTDNLIPVRTSRLQMCAVQRGSGDDLVFVAGLGDEAASWADQVEVFSESFRVTAFDNRGVGQTRAPAGQFTVLDLADDLAALCDTLDIERAHIVGNSMGGAIAQRFGLRHPDRVNSLTLVNTWMAPDALFASVIAGWKDAAPRYRGDVTEFYARLFEWACGFDAYNSGLVAQWLEEMASYPVPQHDWVDEFQRSCDAVLGHNTTGELSAINAPTAVLFGEQDILLGKRFATPLHLAITGARLFALPGVGHSPYLESPTLFNTALDDFLASVG